MTGRLINSVMRILTLLNELENTLFRIFDTNNQTDSIIRVDVFQNDNI